MENENPTLGAIIPSAKGRKIAYALYGAISFIVGNTVVFFAATQMDVPTWLVGAVAVINNIAPIFGAVAIANAPTTPKKADVPMIDTMAAVAGPDAPQPAPELIAEEQPPAK